MRHVSYGFPEVVLEPGTEQTVSIDVKAPFKGNKLVCVGVMKEIRGHFKIKRSRLPLLNRDNVVAYSRIYKWSNGKIFKYRPGKTTVSFAGGAIERGYKHKSFTREYLPSSVEYIHTDPLEYIAIRQLSSDKVPQMPSTSEGVTALFFGANVLGNAMRMEPTMTRLSMVLQNKGDVQVKFYASIFGYDGSPSPILSVEMQRQIADNILRRMKGTVE